MSVEELKKRSSKRRKFLRIFALCCACDSTEDFDLKKDDFIIDNSPVKTIPDEVQPLVYLNQSTNVPNFSLSQYDRHKWARWKAESRVAEWRAASIAYREGKISNLRESLLENPGKLELLRLRENAKQSIKFKHGNVEKVNFFESMELPEIVKSGKSLIWTVLVKPTKVNT